MRKTLAFILICILFCAGCSKNNIQSPDNVTTEPNINSEILLNNLKSYIHYEGNIFDNNKKLNLSFSYKKGVTVPKHPPVVEAKVYLWRGNNLVGIYNKPLYKSYEDYLNPVELTFTADGKAFDRYEVSFNAKAVDEKKTK